MLVSHLNAIRFSWLKCRGRENSIFVLPYTKTNLQIWWFFSRLHPYVSASLDSERLVSGLELQTLTDTLIENLCHFRLSAHVVSLFSLIKGDFHSIHFLWHQFRSRARPVTRKNMVWKRPVITLNWNKTYNKNSVY